MIKYNVDEIYEDKYRMSYRIFIVLLFLFFVFGINRSSLRFFVSFFEHQFLFMQFEHKFEGPFLSILYEGKYIFLQIMEN